MTDKKAGRKPLKEADVVDVNFDDEATAEVSKSTAELAIQASEALDKLGYEGVYDKESVIKQTRFHLDLGALSMLEAGRNLLVIKEMEPHGEFLKVIENRLSLPVRTAQKMMQAATKFLLNPKLASNVSTSAQLGVSKLYELLAESDDDVKALLEGGTIAGASLDEVELMSIKELRAKLKERDQEIENQSRLIDQKNKQMDSLQTKLEMREKYIRESPEEAAFKDAKAEMAEHFNRFGDFLTYTFSTGIETLVNLGGADALDAIAPYFKGIETILNNLRMEFNIPEDFDRDVFLEAARDFEAQRAAKSQGQEPQIIVDIEEQ